MQNVAISSQTSSRNFILTAGLLLYCAAFAILLGNKSFDIAGAVVVLIVFGIVLPLIAWLTTRHAIPLSISIESGAPELIVLVAYVLAVSLYLIGGPQWIDQHLASGWTDSLRIKFLITLAKKLFVFVAIPFAIFRLGFGYRVRDFGIQREGLRALSGSHLLVVLVVGGAFLANISSAAAALRFGVNTSPPLNWFLVYRFASSGFCLRWDWSKNFSFALSFSRDSQPPSHPRRAASC